MLDRLGVEVLRGTTIHTLPVAGDAGLRVVTEAMIARPPVYLMANTGLGIRNWLGLVDTWGLQDPSWPSP